MIWFVFFFAAAVAAADIWVWRRCFRPRTMRPALRGSIAAVLVCFDALPLAVWLIGKLAPDNTRAVMMACMWLIYIYLATSLPRMLFYLFAAISRRRSVRLAGAAASLVLFAVLLRGMAFCRSHLVVNRVEVWSERLPAAFDGLRVVQFSDLHLGTLVRPENEVGRLVDTINALHPDLVVASGDLVTVRYTELDGSMQRLLGSIRAPYGVVSTIGNHDVGVYVKDTAALPHRVNLDRLIARQREMGWLVLDDSTLYLRRGGDSLSLSGISFPHTQRNLRHRRELPDIDVEEVYTGVSDSLFNITVSHLPQLWQRILSLGYGDLTLAGHVHSMQFKVRLGRWRFSPARLLYKQWSGPYFDGGRMLYVNDGIGYVGYPMRLGACPEVTLFVLHRGTKENEP